MGTTRVTDDGGWGLPALDPAVPTVDGACCASGETLAMAAAGIRPRRSRGAMEGSLARQPASEQGPAGPTSAESAAGSGAVEAAAAGDRADGGAGDA